MSPRLSGRALEAIDAGLSGRERAIISLLAELRFLSTRQLERWVFSGRTPLARARASRRSVAKLVELGLVRHLQRRVGGVRAGSAGSINVLTPLGLRLASVYGWVSPERVRRMREPGGQFVRHYLCVAEAHLLAVEAEEAGRWELLAREAEPTCWRTFTGPHGRQVLKPDGFFAIGHGPWRTHWFVEIDRSTASGATLERKLALYVAYWRDGGEVATRGVFPRVLWLVGDTHRLDVVRQAFRRTPSEAQVLFAVAPFERVITALTGDEP